MPDVRDGSAAAVPTSAELVDRARAAFGLLRRDPARTPDCPVGEDAAVRALGEAGLFKLAVPRRYGGYETSVSAMLDVTGAVAESDGAAAWAVGLINVCCWMTGLFSVRAQDDVWGADPEARVTGAFAPSGESAEVEGGYRVSGRWYYNWSSWPAQWAVVGFPRSGPDGELVDYSMALVPMRELRIGAAGEPGAKGGHLVAEDLFVPAHRVLSVTEANAGSCRNELADDEPLYRSALMPVLLLMLIGPQLGLARTALRIVRSRAADTVVGGTVYECQSDSVAFQLRVARAALMMDSAYLHAHRAAREIDTAAQQGQALTALDRARIHGEAGWIAENVHRAIDTLLTAHGSGGPAASGELERVWRYSTIAGLHALVTPDARYETYGKALLGIDEAIVPLL